MAISKITTNSITDDAVTTAKVNPAQTDITSVGTLTSFRSTGIDDNANALAMTIDSSERVGIGEASPSDKLHVKGGQIQLESLAGDGAYIRINNTANTNGDIWRLGVGIYAHDTLSIYDQTNNVFPFNFRQINKTGEIKSATFMTQLADDASVSIGESSQGLIIVTSYNHGLTFIGRHEYASNVQVVSANGTWSTSDTDGKICVFSGTNDYSITLKNRMGGARDFKAIFIGTYQ
tara:strand:- start:301 stop:1002 length:702 start_codon:yes stop_codon:yes gene_type:complete